MRHSNSDNKHCRRMHKIKLSVQNETKRCRRRLVIKFGALGECGQCNYKHTEKRQSEKTFSTTSLNYSPKVRKLCVLS
jgi:hypothetical protein